MLLKKKYYIREENLYFYLFMNKCPKWKDLKRKL